eukprot:gene9008-10674_t
MESDDPSGIGEDTSDVSVGFGDEQLNYSAVKEAARYFPELREEVLLKLLHGSSDEHFRKPSSKKGTMGRRHRSLVKGPEPSVAKQILDEYDADEEAKQRLRLLKSLRAQVEKEKLAGFLEFRRVAGVEELVFGEVIQLRHRLSGNFLTVRASGLAELDQNSCKVELWHHGSEASWFRVLPGFKAKSAGEVVKFGDSITLQSVSIPELYVHVGFGPQEHTLTTTAAATLREFWQHSTLPSPYILYSAEVNASHQSSRFKIVPFAKNSAFRALAESEAKEVVKQLEHVHKGLLMISDTSELGYSNLKDVEESELLLGGQMLQMYHRESSSYLVCNPSVDGDDEVVFQQDRATATDGVTAPQESGGDAGLHRERCKNSNSFWKVYRLKHIATNKFLRASNIRPWNMLRNAIAHGYCGPQGMVRVMAVNRASSSDGRKLEMTEEYHSPNTLWRLRPFQTWKEEKMREGHEGGFPPGCLLYFENVATGKLLTPRDGKACVTSLHLEGNAMCLHVVHQTELANLWPVVHAKNCMSIFISKVREAPPLDSPKATLEDEAAAAIGDPSLEYLAMWQEVINSSVLGSVVLASSVLQTKVLKSLLQQLTPWSKDQDMMLRDGSPNFALQDCLREQCYLQLIVSLLKEFFEVRRIPTMLMNRIGNQGFQLLCQLAYRLLKQACKGSKTNKAFMSQHTSMLQMHLGTEMKAANTLMEIYTGNLQLVQSITDENLDRFMQLVRRYRKPRFVAFLIVCAECEDTPVKHNQDRIIEFLRTNKGLPFGGQGGLQAYVFRAYSLAGVFVQGLLFGGQGGLQAHVFGAYRSDLMPTVRIVEGSILQLEERSVELVDPMAGPTAPPCKCHQYSKTLDKEEFRDGEESSPIDESEHLLRYYIQMLKLYRVLCMGQNETAAALLLDLASRIGTGFHELVTMAQNATLPYMQRTHAVELLGELYIRVPRDVCPALLKLTRCWDLSRKPEPARPFQKGAGNPTFLRQRTGLTPAPSPCSSTPASVEDCSEAVQNSLGIRLDTLKTFILMYIEDVKFDFSRPSMNHLTKSVLELLNTLIECGHYTKPWTSSSLLAWWTGSGKARSSIEQRQLQMEEEVRKMSAVSSKAEANRDQASLEAVRDEHDLTQIKDLVAPLMELLDGRTDVQQSAGNERYQYTDDASAVIDAKVDPGVRSLTFLADAETGIRRLMSSAMACRHEACLRLRLFAMMVICRILTHMFTLRLDKRAMLMQQRFEVIYREIQGIRLRRIPSAFTRSVSMVGTAVNHLRGFTEVEGMESSSGTVDGDGVERKTGMWMPAQLDQLRELLFGQTFLSELVAHHGTDNLKAENVRAQAPTHFMQVLLDQLRYHYPPLVLKSFDLLHKHLTQRMELVQFVNQDLQLVSDVDLLHRYPLILHGVRALQHCRREIAAGKTSSAVRAAIQTALHVLGTLSGPFGEIDFSNQWMPRLFAKERAGEQEPEKRGAFQDMLGNMGMVEQVILLLQPFAEWTQSAGRSGWGAQETTLLCRLKAKCHWFLQQCCMGPTNARNQRLLQQHAPALRIFMETPGLDTPTTMLAFLETHKVLEQGEDTQAIVRRCALAIKKFGQQVRWLRIMGSTLVDDGLLVKESQEHTLKVLQEHRDSVALLWNDEAGFVERAKLMAIREYLDPRCYFTSKLMYHLEFVLLVGVCAREGSSFQHNMARTFYTFQDVIRHIIDSDLYRTGEAWGSARGGSCSPDAEISEPHSFRLPMLVIDSEGREGAPGVQYAEQATTSELPPCCLVKDAFVLLLEAVFFTAEDGRAMMEEADGFRVWSGHVERQNSGIQPPSAFMDVRKEGVEHSLIGRISFAGNDFVSATHPDRHLMQVFVSDIRAAQIRMELRPYIYNTVLPCISSYVEHIQE